jgi:hypothetical protein
VKEIPSFSGYRKGIFVHRRAAENARFSQRKNMAKKAISSVQ